MEAKELRIGNWIYSNTDKDIYRVDLIESWRNYLSISAIPLTEEWLLRLGFTIQRVPSAYGWDCNKVCENPFYILRGAWNGKSWFALEILNNDSHKEIEFVHQLQNLYFSLTGLELEYGS